MSLLGRALIVGLPIALWETVALPICLWLPGHNGEMIVASITSLRQREVNQ